MSEITGISENIPATSKYFRRFSEDFQCTKIFRRLLSTSEANKKTTVFVLCNIQLGYKNQHYPRFWNIFGEIELNFLYNHVLKNNSSGFVGQA